MCTHPPSSSLDCVLLQRVLQRAHHRRCKVVQRRLLAWKVKRDAVSNNDPPLADSHVSASALKRAPITVLQGHRVTRVQGEAMSVTAAITEQNVASQQL